MKKRSDSELSKKNGAKIRPTGFVSETFWVNSSGGFEVLENFFFLKKSSFLSFRFISVSLHFLVHLLFILSFLRQDERGETRQDKRR